MITIRQCASLLMLIGLLVFTQSQYVMAASPNISDALMQCDGLLGKSTKAVLAVLGTPVRTDQISPVHDSPHFISWTYYSSDNKENLSVYFYNGTLVAAYMNQTAIPTLVGFLKICKPDSRKYIYRINDAQELAQPNGKTFCQLLINGKTQRGHLIRAICLTSPSSPLAYKHIFNATSGLYEDKFASNPGFSVKQVFTVQQVSLSAGTGAVYERDHWTGTELSAYQSRFNEGHTRNLTAYMESVVPSFSSWPVVVAPLTLENSPWFQQ